MRSLFAAALVVHGLIHLLGAGKAAGIIDLPQLKSISPAMGFAWLLSALLFLVAALGLYAWPRGWWAVAIAGVLISESAIVASWAVAKFGTVPNIAVMVCALFGLFIEGPVSLRAQFEADVDRRLAQSLPSAIVGEHDLARLPEPVQRYLRVAGVVGHERPRNMYATLHGRIRSGPDASWMPFTAEQYNFLEDRARLFYMELTRGPLAAQGFHRYVGPVADMRVYIAGLIPVARASGEEMTRSETVTMLNDMAVLAPAALLDPSIQWTTIDACTVVASFANAMMSITSTMEFNEAGELVNFWSDDRSQLGPDGNSLRRLHWSTPLGTYQDFTSSRLASYGEARWGAPAASYSYIELHIDDVQYNLKAGTH